jgi:sugar phosphate isomerase/epimerase
MGLSGQTQPGVQAHCLRREMAVDFPGTLQRLHAMGFRQIEMCSFPGCAGNPWGDFGELAAWEPVQIRAALDNAGFDSIATHVAHKELASGSINDTVRWVEGTGSSTVVLAGLPQRPESSLADWHKAFASLNDIGTHLRERGIRFAYHTQIDVWQVLGGTLLADELFRIVDPGLCLFELDPSGALVHGTDWMSVVRAHPDRYLAMHLRDGSRPSERVPYLPALPLGEGEVNWDAALDAAIGAGIDTYLLEMEVDADRDVFDALRSSLDFLETMQGNSQ